MYWDFGFNYHSTLARINLQKHLTAKYPNVQSDHVFDMIVMSFDEPCDPRFTQWLNDGVDVIFGQVSRRHHIDIRQHAFGYTAGLVTKSKKICVSAPMRLPAPVMDTTGFCRGVQHADPSVQ
eukprot:EG_transcript_49463